MTQLQKISFQFRGARNLVRLGNYLRKVEDSSYLGIENRMIWSLFIYSTKNFATFVANNF